MTNPQEILRKVAPPIYTGSLPSEKVDMFDALQDAIISITEETSTVAAMYGDARFSHRVFSEIVGTNPDMRLFQFTGTNGFCCLVAYELDSNGQIRVHCNELNDVVIAYAYNGKQPHLLTCFDSAFAQHPDPNVFADPALLPPKAADDYFEAALEHLRPNRRPIFVRGGNSIANDVKL